MGSVFAETFTEKGGVDAVDIVAGGAGGEGGGEAGGFTHGEAYGHYTDAALDDAFAGDGATGDEDVAQADRSEAAVGDAVRVALGVVFKTGGGLDLVDFVFVLLFGLVEVDEVAVAADLVGEGAAVEVVVEHEHVVAGDAAGFADAEDGAGGGDKGVGESGRMRGERAAVGLGEPAALGEGSGDGGGVGVVHAPDVAGVETDDAGADEVAAEMFVGDFRIQTGIDDGVDGTPRVPPADVAGVFEGVGIDVGEGETERGGLGLAGGVALLERGSGPGGEIGVAGAVDVDLGAKGGEAGFVGDEDRGDASVGIGLDAGELGLKEDGRAGVGDEGVVDAFEAFGVDGHPVEGLGFDVGETFFGGGEDLFGESAVDDFFLVGERTPGGHEGAGAGAAEGAGGLDEQGARALAGGGDGGGAAGGAAAGHDHVPTVVEGERAGVGDVGVHA